MNARIRWYCKRIKEKFFERRFAHAVQRILDTPALQPGETPFAVLSMVQPKDLLPYLVAVKSFARFTRPARVVLVADSRMGEKEFSILRKHIPFIEIVPAAECRLQGIPIGGTWERLLHIAKLVEQGEYVVQLDADTVTLNSPAEVIEAIHAQHSFVLCTANGQSLASVNEIARATQLELAKESGKTHVQMISEANLDAVSELGQYSYVRACSGFAGFAPGAISPEKLQQVSKAMSARLGDRWSEWGTEQVTSNLIASSAPDSRLLPHPKYCAPHWSDGHSVFFHFIGFVRYINGLYERVTRRVIEELQAAR